MLKPLERRVLAASRRSGQIQMAGRRQETWQVFYCDPAPSLIGGSCTCSWAPYRWKLLECCKEVLAIHPSARTQTAEKLTSAVGATLPLRPGAAAQLQYALVYAIDCSGVTGKPHSRMSSVVCASETSVAS